MATVSRYTEIPIARMTPEKTISGYRESMLGLLAERVNLLPPEMPAAVRDVVFNVAAKFPMKRMELGVQYRGLPMDVEGFVKQIEHDLKVG